MITILPAILGMIGKVLLILLLVLAVLIALILFVPVHYKAAIRKKDAGLSAQIRISWLLRIVYVRAALEKGKDESHSGVDVRLAGIRILDLLKNRKKKSGKKRKEKSSGKPERIIRREAVKKPTVKPGSRREGTEEIRPLSVEVTKAKHPNLLIRISARISALIGKIRRLWKKIAGGAGILRDWIEYLGSESFDRAKTVLLHEGGALLRHILPRQIAGDLLFGTDDPAKTGMILGIIGVLYPVIPEKLQIEPDFTESVLETDLTCRGHVLLIVLLVRVIRILLCRDVRLLIGRIRREWKAGKGKKESKTVHKGRGRTWRKTKKTLHFRTT